MIAECTMQSSDRVEPGSVTFRHLDDPVVLLDIAGEERRLRGHEAWHRDGRTARTLVKNDRLRIVLVDLQAGSRLGWHRTGSNLSLQVVTGAVSVGVPGATHNLTAGQLLVLDASIPHEVAAVDDAAFLLTLAPDA